MTGRPLWRRVFDGVERPVAARLEGVVQTELFADAAGLALRLRADVGRRVERTSRRALHRVNLPAASDVARLNAQVAALNRSVRRLDESVRRAAHETPGGADGPDDRAGRPGRAGAPRRRPQPAAGPQRRQVRGRDRPPEGGPDAEGRRLAP